MEDVGQLLNTQNTTEVPDKASLKRISEVQIHQKSEGNTNV